MNQAQSGDLLSIGQIKSRVLTWEVIVLTCYAILIFFGAMQHEPWRDEAQSWLIARDIPLSQLFQHINYEGTPALWHLILMPFAKTGFPPSTLTYIHLTFVLLAATIFTYKAPFSRLTKVLFLFSFYMGWEYAVIARNYNLTVLFVFAIAASYGERFSKPIVHCVLILLLFNTNVHSFFIATALLMLYVYEVGQSQVSFERFKGPIAIACLGALLALLQLLPAADNMRAEVFHEFNYRALPRAIMNAFVPLSRQIDSGIHDYLPFVFLTLTALGVFVYSCIYLFKRSKEMFVVYILSILGLFYLFVFKYYGGYRHHGFILIFLIFSLWTSTYYKLSPKYYTDDLFNKKWTLILLNGTLAFSLLASALMHFSEQTQKYSGAKDMSTYLSTIDLSDQVLIGSPSTLSSTLALYLPNQLFWYPDIEDFGTYIVWTKKFEKSRYINFQEVEKRIRANKLDNDHSLIVFNAPVPVKSLLNYELIYKIDKHIFGPSDERYYLYQILNK